MNASALRILDANMNRAREGLRVVEDYARFHLDDRGLCGELKHLRHELAGATGRWLADAVMFRDTAGDVGTGNTAAGEFARAGMGDVVVASCKRVGEALRTVEEYLKVFSAEDARVVEGVRYRFYEVEKRVVLSFGLNRERFGNVRLYVLITESACKRDWKDVVEGAIAGGADCLQLREKELESGELLARARWMVEKCREAGVISVINDRADIALLADADGVHVGQGDLPIGEVRKIVGRGKIVGVSTHEIEQARRAQAEGADYVGVGPVFRSGTKPREILPGVEFARRVAREIVIPGVAIAGITLGNLEEVLGTGIGAVAVTAAVAGAEDVVEATRLFKDVILRRVAV